MANPWTGEVAIGIDGRPRVMKLTLGALAELEAEMGAESLLDLVDRFEAGRFATRDVIALIVAGLRGGGWAVTPAEVMEADIEGGPVGAARKAGELLARAFALPEG